MSLEDYTKNEKLGEGTYGVVYRAIDNNTNEVVALKQMRLEQEEEGIPVTAMREAALLRNLNHPNILSVRDIICTKGSLTIVSEYLNFDLRKYLNLTHSGLEPALLKSYAFQLLCGICYLHSNRMMHRDMKPQNLLINKSGFLKICDFGLARLFSLHNRRYTHEVVTLWYRPPELLLGSPDYDISIDVWGAGCIIAEMIHGKVLFDGDSEIDELFHIFRVKGTPDAITWPEFTKLPNYSANFPIFPAKNLGEVVGTNDPLLIDLLDKLLQVNPSKRLSAKAALSHPYFADVPPKLISICLPQGVTLDQRSV
ncbi:hypothetical protein M9Y10_001476 [Tritrichomonas musculus]|uniref:cyclin-dependent kinase n=1 Tax=Tritrichomonas musculus TaxID=1915356 RepID=A0ABR2L741_9EUKA